MRRAALAAPDARVSAQGRLGSRPLPHQRRLEPGSAGPVRAAVGDSGDRLRGRRRPWRTRRAVGVVIGRHGPRRRNALHPATSQPQAPSSTGSSPRYRCRLRYISNEAAISPASHASHRYRVLYGRVVGSGRPCRRAHGHIGAAGGPLTSSLAISRRAQDAQQSPGGIKCEIGPVVWRRHSDVPGGVRLWGGQRNRRRSGTKARSASAKPP